jgi:hypothetical protein
MTTQAKGAGPLREPGDELGAIRQVGEALVARHTEIAKGMVERIVDEVPTYRRAPPEVIDDVLVLSTATAELLGQAFAAGSQVQQVLDDGSPGSVRCTGPVGSATRTVGV